MCGTPLGTANDASGVASPDDVAARLDIAGRTPPPPQRRRRRYRNAATWRRRG
jgi:hypothetical protein